MILQWRKSLQEPLLRHRLFKMQISGKKKESAPNGDEASAPASVVSVEELGMHEGMSQEEIAATQECIKYAVMLRKGGLSREEKADLKKPKRFCWK